MYALNKKKEHLNEIIFFCLNCFVEPKQLHKVHLNLHVIEEILCRIVSTTVIVISMNLRGQPVIQLSNIYVFNLDMYATEHIF